MTTVYLGLGSNIGNRKNYLNKAIKQLYRNSIQIEKISRIIETAAVDGPPQSRFLNIALRATTKLSPHQLLQLIKKIETDLGRRPTVRNGPRVIDIDILLYDNLKIKNHDLIIPHAKMLERDFVMRPLSEIAPAIVRKLIYAHYYKY